jgi:hypothetical protein
MIITECCYCDEPLVVGYESGGEGAGGFAPVECEKCHKTSVVQLVSFGGTTYTEENFKKEFIDSGKVKKNNF